MKKIEVLKRIVEGGIVAVVRADSEEKRKD